MKKLLFAILAIGSVTTVSAQSKTTFGISGGLNFAKIKASISGSSTSASSGSLTSFSVGFFADAPLGGNFSIQPGLYYTGKGGKTDFEAGPRKAKLTYLHLPLNVVYSVPISTGKFFFGAGPYGAYGLSAKIEIEGQATEKFKFGNDDNSDIKRTDFGATGLIGFNFTNGLLLKANYDLGLTNILPNNNGGHNMKNRVLGVSVGFAF